MTALSCRLEDAEAVVEMLSRFSRNHLSKLFFWSLWGDKSLCSCKIMVCFWSLIDMSGCFLNFTLVGPKSVLIYIWRSSTPCIWILWHDLSSTDQYKPHFRPESTELVTYGYHCDWWELSGRWCSCSNRDYKLISQQAPGQASLRNLLHQTHQLHIGQVEWITLRCCRCKNQRPALHYWKWLIVFHHCRFWLILRPWTDSKSIVQVNKLFYYWFENE